ncbi:MAG TPA: hypothetical protein VNH38_02420 [Candidatus Dormibacteraeota bacterium]|nr:hypothetical protein [Candidatus Dormibacteraeota bacterium]
MAADRFVLVALALVALKLANSEWLSSRIPGEDAVLANDALQFLCFLVFVGLIALSCRARLPDWIRRRRPGRALVLAPVVLVVLLGLVSASIVRSLATDSLQIDDANAMAICGAQAISAGRDPYHVKEISCLRHMGLSTTLATPLRKGPLAKIDGYPTPAQIEAAIRTASRQGGTQTLFSGLAKLPLDSAVMLPVAHSPAQVRALWTLSAVAVFAVLLGLAAGPLWVAALAGFVATYYIPGSALNFASFGNAEAVAYLLMALSVLWIRRPLLSGICLGLAIGSNELALFFLPAYLLLSLRMDGRPRRLLALVLTVVVGVVPWVLRYPDAIPTIWHNLAAPTFPLGYGPVILVLQGVIKPPPSDLLLGLAGGAMVLLLIWGWRRPAWRISAAVIMLSGFWLSWRSLDEYMAQIPLLAVVAVLALLTTGELEADGGAPASPGGRAAERINPLAEAEPVRPDAPSAS